MLRYMMGPPFRWEGNLQGWMTTTTLQQDGPGGAVEVEIADAADLTAWRALHRVPLSVGICQDRLQVPVGAWVRVVWTPGPFGGTSPLLRFD